MTTLDSTLGAARRADGFGALYRAFEHRGMYAFLARAQAERPVFYAPEIDYWVVTRRADILPLLQDADRFSAAIALAPAVPLAPEARAILEAGFGAEPTQVNCDPPKHTRIRRIAGTWLNQKRFAALEPDIRRIARGMIAAWGGRAEVDLVADLVYEFPARVLFLLMGIPDADAPRIKRWADFRLLLTFGDLGPEDQLRGAADMVAYWRYCAEMVEDRKRSPRGDYASWLLGHLGAGEDRLSENEIRSLVFGLLLAGHETTTNLSGNALHALLTHREAWEAIVADPSLIPNAVEEVLRFASSVVCWRRRAKVPVTIAGVEIPEGANLLLALGAANRDPAHFAEPDRFDIRRAEAREHLSFGKGLHFCLGAPLARLELRILLEELSARHPDLALAGPGTEPDYIRTIAFRGPTRLPARPGRDSGRWAAQGPLSPG